MVIRDKDSEIFATQGQRATVKNVRQSGMEDDHADNLGGKGEEREKRGSWSWRTSIAGGIPRHNLLLLGFWEGDTPAEGHTVGGKWISVLSNLPLRRDVAICVESEDADQRRLNPESTI